MHTISRLKTGNFGVTNQNIDACSSLLKQVLKVLTTTPETNIVAAVFRWIAFVESNSLLADENRLFYELEVLETLRKFDIFFITFDSFSVNVQLKSGVF